MSFISNSPNRWGVQRRNLNVNLDDSLIAYETTHEYIVAENFEQYAERLQRKLAKEQRRLDETRNSLPLYRRQENAGTQYSWNEICAQALILISEFRIATYQELINRVYTFRRMRIGPPPLALDARSSFEIFNMVISLSRGFYMTNGRDPEDTNYVFMVIGSTNEKTSATQLVQVSSNAVLRNRNFRIDERMKFFNLPLNFRIQLTVYCMKLTPRQNKSPKAMAKKAFNYISKLASPGANLNASFKSNVDEHEHTAFERAGSIVLTRKTLGSFTAFLDHPMFPLDGAVDINCKVSVLPDELNKEWKGVWTFIGPDKPEPEEYFVSMLHGVINCFLGPEKGYHAGEPSLIIDLSTVCDHEVNPLTDQYEDHPYVFPLNVVHFPRGEEVAKEIAYIISVGNEEELNSWITGLNLCLNVIQARTDMN